MEKHKENYVSPLMAVIEGEPEGVICVSGETQMQDYIIESEQDW